MSKRIIISKNAPAPIGPYSQAVRTGNMLFLSGQIALDPTTGELHIENLDVETELVMKNIGAILAEEGLDYSHIVKSSIFLSDMGNFSKVNEIYGKYFDENPPARETVEVACLPKNVNVEISVIAVAP